MRRGTWIRTSHHTEPTESRANAGKEKSIAPRFQRREAEWPAAQSKYWAHTKFGRSKESSPGKVPVADSPVAVPFRVEAPRLPKHYTAKPARRGLPATISDSGRGACGPVIHLLSWHRTYVSDDTRWRNAKRTFSASLPIRTGRARSGMDHATGWTLSPRISSRESAALVPGDLQDARVGGRSVIAAVPRAGRGCDHCFLGHFNCGRSDGHSVGCPGLRASAFKSRAGCGGGAAPARIRSCN